MNKIYLVLIMFACFYQFGCTMVEPKVKYSTEIKKIGKPYQASLKYEITTEFLDDTDLKISLIKKITKIQKKQINKITWMKSCKYNVVSDALETVICPLVLVYTLPKALIRPDSVKNRYINIKYGVWGSVIAMFTPGIIVGDKSSLKDVAWEKMDIDKFNKEETFSTILMAKETKIFVSYNNNYKTSFKTNNQGYYIFNITNALIVPNLLLNFFLLNKLRY